MTRALTAAATRRLQRRERAPGLVALTTLGAFMAYVWSMCFAAIYLFVSFRFPEQRPHTFEGFEALGYALSAANALWALVIVLELAAVLRGPRHRRRDWGLTLVSALVVLGLMQRFAFLVIEVARW
jgi:hypothetical protein